MTEVSLKGPEDGLQAERTALAWSRTSFAVLGNGALLLLRELHHYNGPLRLAPAVVVALATYLIGLRRQRLLRIRPLPRRVGAGLEVHIIGISVIVLIVVTAFALPV